MVDLDDLEREPLIEALRDVSDPKAAKRLMAVLAYKDGVNVADFADRYGIPRSTVYHWLGRFEERSLAAAMVDAPRPGRPPRLDEERRAAVRSDLEQPPTAFGYAAPAWDASLLQTHLASAYDVSYSVAHVRRIRDEIEP